MDDGSPVRNKATSAHVVKFRLVQPTSTQMFATTSSSVQPLPPPLAGSTQEQVSESNVVPSNSSHDKGNPISCEAVHSSGLEKNVGTAWSQIASSSLHVPLSPPPPLLGSTQAQLIASNSRPSSPHD